MERWSMTVATTSLQTDEIIQFPGHQMNALLLVRGTVGIAVVDQPPIVILLPQPSHHACPIEIAFENAHPIARFAPKALVGAAASDVHRGEQIADFLDPMPRISPRTNVRRVEMNAEAGMIDLPQILAKLAQAEQEFVPHCLESDFHSVLLT